MSHIGVRALFGGTLSLSSGYGDIPHPPQGGLSATGVKALAPGLGCSKKSDGLPPGPE
jgi:hypothetical protein